MMRRTLFACLIGLLTVAGLSGCSIPTSVPTPTTSSPSGPADPGVGGSGAGGGGGTGSSSEAPPPPTSSDPQLGPVVASRTTSNEGRTVHLDLYRIVRDGKLAHVTFAVRSSDDQPVGDMFSARLLSRFQPMVDIADGVTLTDTAHSKLYLVAGQGKYQCLCSMDLSNVVLQDNRPALISASFAAPPSEVTEMDVQIPRFGVFTRVPVV